MSAFHATVVLSGSVKKTTWASGKKLHLQYTSTNVMLTKGYLPIPFSTSLGELLNRLLYIFETWTCLYNTNNTNNIHKNTS